ncbi:MAG TPA: hypothetical protein VH186_25110 [Chloroflexia bacterium]|nr:hypothetical protein [Chloroflexia bacterium]
MSKTKPPTLNKNFQKSNRPPTPGRPNGRKPQRELSPEPDKKSSAWNWQKQVLAVLGAVVLVSVLVILLSQPQDRTDRRVLDNAVGTAVASTGFTPPPTIVPGSDFGILLTIFGKKDYLPSRPDEKVQLVISNTRQKSFFISNCDGVVLQRFLGTDPNDTSQTGKMENWDTIAPGGFPFCGPATGRQSRQVEPGVNADATFKFDMKVTRPFNGKSWDVPGTYRLLVTYYLLCPNSSLSIDDCEDKHLAESDYFRIIAVADQPPVPTASANKPIPTIAPTVTSKP